MSDGAEEGLSGRAGLTSTGPRVSSLSSHVSVTFGEKKEQTYSTTVKQSNNIGHGQTIPSSEVNKYFKITLNFIDQVCLNN